MSDKYTFVVDSFSVEQWQMFSGAFVAMNIYQTWEYAELHSSGLLRHVSRAVVLDSADSPKVTAQFRMKKLPGIKVGVADVEWGPLWDTEDKQSGYEALSFFVRRVRQEYST
jgi:hypothetical protein